MDLTYQITAGGGGGIVSPRDFTILRQTSALNHEGLPVDGEDVIPHCYISSGISVPVPGYPPTKDFVRLVIFSKMADRRHVYLFF